MAKIKFVPPQLDQEKSTLLLHACTASKEPVLILTYNKLLEVEMSENLEASGMSGHKCYTFHGLCSTVFAPTPDDETMHQILDNPGQYPPLKVLNFRRICIDESQDLKEVYAKLIVTLFSTTCQWFLVGDEIQMLNDYDEDDPALLDYMISPAATLGSADNWVRTRLSTSFRLTPTVTSFVNCMLENGEPLISGNTVDRVCKVQISTCGNWKWKEVVIPWVIAVKKRNPNARIFILVARKKNNPPLQILVNSMTCRGFPLYIHGIDGQDARIQKGKITISTFHASKGMQADACAVLGVEQNDKHNPLHVALTRSKSELLVVQNSMRPRQRLIETTMNAEDDEYVMDDITRKMNMDCVMEDSDMPVRTIRDLNNWSARGRSLSLHALVEEVSQTDSMSDADPVVPGNRVELMNRGQYGDVYDIYRMAAVMIVENNVTGKCKFYEFMKKPVRYKANARDMVILERRDDYTVDSRVLDNNELIPQYAWKILSSMSGVTLTHAHWGAIAAMALCWNKFHHTLHYTIPCNWMNMQTLENAIDNIYYIVKDYSGEFDVRLVRQVDDMTYHARCFFASTDVVVTVVYTDDCPRSTRLNACIPLALHATAHTAILVNALTGKTNYFTVSCKEEFCVCCECDSNFPVYRKVCTLCSLL